MRWALLLLPSIVSSPVVEQWEKKKSYLIADNRRKMSAFNEHRQRQEKTLTVHKRTSTQFIEAYCRFCKKLMASNVVYSGKSAQCFSKAPFFSRYVLQN